MVTVCLPCLPHGLSLSSHIRLCLQLCPPVCISYVCYVRSCPTMSKLRTSCSHRVRCISLYVPPMVPLCEPSSFPCARSYPFHTPSMPHVSAMSAYVSSCLSYVSSCGFRGCPFSMRMRCPYEIGRDSWVRGGQVSVVLKKIPLNKGRSSHRMHMEHKRKRSVPLVG